MTSVTRRLVLAGVLAGMAGCHWITGTPVPEQVVTAACGMCVFKQTDVAGCYWAVEIDGDYYPVNGPVPADHDSHGPGGMCTMPRRARVAGKLRSGQLFADVFDLLPLDDGEVPVDAPAHEHAH